MADVFSIIGLLSTAATLANTVLGYTAAVKGASKEIEMLTCEFSSLNIVIEKLVEYVKSEESRGKA